MDVEEVQEFVAVEPATYPLAERITAEEIVDLFRLREQLPRMQNAPQLAEACGA